MSIEPAFVSRQRINFRFSATHKFPVLSLVKFFLDSSYGGVLDYAFSMDDLVGGSIFFSFFHFLGLALLEVAFLQALVQRLHESLDNAH